MCDSMMEPITGTEWIITFSSIPIESLHNPHLKNRESDACDMTASIGSQSCSDRQFSKTVNTAQPDRSHIFAHDDCSVQRLCTRAFLAPAHLSLFNRSDPRSDDTIPRSDRNVMGSISCAHYYPHRTFPVGKLLLDGKKQNACRRGGETSKYEIVSSNVNQRLGLLPSAHDNVRQAES